MVEDQGKDPQKLVYVAPQETPKKEKKDAQTEPGPLNHPKCLKATALGPRRSDSENNSVQIFFSQACRC